MSRKSVLFILVIALVSFYTTATGTVYAAEPTPAMVAYQDSTASSTPRYRTWNGTVWTAESSANTVGGTIQWMVLKNSPQSKEKILGTLDASDDINVQIWNGA